jgi:hypothetical protein
MSGSHNVIGFTPFYTKTAHFVLADYHSILLLLYTFKSNVFHEISNVLLSFSIYTIDLKTITIERLIFNIARTEQSK